MAHDPSRSSRSAYKLVYPDGVTPPTPEHFRQVVDLMIRFNEMPVEVRDLFCRSLLSDKNNLAFKVFEQANKGKIDIEKPIVQLRKRPKAERDAEIIRLRRQGKSAGQIAKLIKNQFGVTSTSTIRSVFLREKHKKK